MSARPKLQVAPVASPRPFATFYYAIGYTPQTGHTKVGHASKEIGAVRAAVVRVLTRQYHTAIIHNEAGAVIARIMRERNTIKIIHVPSIGRAD